MRTTASLGREFRIFTASNALVFLALAGVWQLHRPGLHSLSGLCHRTAVRHRIQPGTRVHTGHQQRCVVFWLGIRGIALLSPRPHLPRQLPRSQQRHGLHSPTHSATTIRPLPARLAASAPKVRACCCNGCAQRPGNRQAWIWVMSWWCDKAIDWQMPGYPFAY